MISFAGTMSITLFWAIYIAFSFKPTALSLPAFFFIALSYRYSFNCYIFSFSVIPIAVCYFNVVLILVSSGFSFLAVFRFLLSCWPHRIIAGLWEETGNTLLQYSTIRSVHREVYSGGTFRKSMNYYSFREKDAKNIIVDFVGRYTYLYFRMLTDGLGQRWGIVTSAKRCRRCIMPIRSQSPRIIVVFSV
jgi:hypothetical protein